MFYQHKGSTQTKGERKNSTIIILRNGNEQLTLSSVQQTVAFLLNETGTKLAVEMNMGVDMDGPSRGRPQPKNMILDKPFYIIVKKRDDNISPYLVLWINNTELMEINLGENKAVLSCI